MEHFGKTQIADKLGVVNPHPRLGGKHEEFCSWIAMHWLRRVLLHSEIKIVTLR